MKAIRDGYRKHALRIQKEQGKFGHVAVRVEDLLAILSDADELEQLQQAAQLGALRSDLE